MSSKLILELEDHHQNLWEMSRGKSLVLFSCYSCYFAEELVGDFWIISPFSSLCYQWRSGANNLDLQMGRQQRSFCYLEIHPLPLDFSFSPFRLGAKLIKHLRWRTGTGKHQSPQLWAKGVPLLENCLFSKNNPHSHCTTLLRMASGMDLSHVHLLPPLWILCDF